ncbi:MAG: filamentous hemagglutinin N-terminal domain-containing protein [Phormidesmis sp.]
MGTLSDSNHVPQEIAVKALKLKAFSPLIFFGAEAIAVGLLSFSPPVKAQVIPDSRVGTPISVDGNITGGTTTIDGTQQNLFHSFQAFSLDPADTITFIAPNSVENIITRVTGQLPSEINGTLRVDNTTSNLFLINPAGIVFGPSAQLQVPGSFIASTAEQITFENGFAFDTDSLNAPPLMTVSAPIGLQIGSGSITVNNSGHNIAKLNITDPSQGANGGIAPHVQQGSTPGLQVMPGSTLALIGNGVTFNGGVVTANSGHVEIGSVAEGSVVSLAWIIHDQLQYKRKRA